MTWRPRMAFTMASGRPSLIAVFVSEGSTTLIVIPSSPSVAASARVKPTNAHLGCAVGNRDRARDCDRRRADIDDSTPTAAAHERQKGFAHEHGAVEVHGHHSLPEVVIKFIPGGCLEHPCVIDQDVDATQFTHDAITCSCNR